MNRFLRSLVVVCLSLTPCPLAIAEERELFEAPPDATCAEHVAAARFEAALTQCRTELEASPDDPELMRATAAAEYAAGSAEAAASLWQSLLDREGWQAELAHELAMSQWRAGRTAEAEATLRDIVDRAPSPEASHALVSFLLLFDRVDDATATASAAVTAYPESCELAEDLGVAHAAAEHDEQAAASLARAIELGCPPFRWVSRGMLAQNYDRPAYAGLLTAQALISDLDRLSDAEVRDRFKLLKPRMAMDAADAVTGVVLNRRTAEVRLAGLGLLTTLGPEALPYWNTILGTDDFILEKHALRRIREAGDPSFIPLLETRLQAEQTPGNRALTQLTIGELLLASGKVEEATAAMEAIDDADQLQAVALMVLADHAEATGDPQAALAYIERAQTIDPMTFVTPSRLEKLRKAVGVEGEDAPAVN